MFFGPTDSPLFGALHVPADHAVRAGVVICSSIGKEAMDSVRFQRIFADQLAGLGFAVLRFDYLGTGDSSLTQTREDAVDTWRGSVGHAVDYLRGIGCSTFVGVGMRAGALILSEFVKRDSESLSHVVYFDPPVSGRRYLREKTALFRMVAGVDAVPPGTVSIVGARMSAPAAAAFGALTLRAAARADVNHLLVLRPGELDHIPDDLTDRKAVQTVAIDGLVEFTRAPVPMPLPAIPAMATWIDGAVPRVFEQASPTYETSAVMTMDGPDGIDTVIETIEYISPRGLFAIRTAPARPRGDGHGVVLFFATANDTHIGPGREWVELSRRIALDGREAMRWDRTGLGQSGPISQQKWQRIFARNYVADAKAAARHAARQPSDLVTVGVCSGGWYAAHVARTMSIGSVIWVNPNTWNWRVHFTRRMERVTKNSLLRPEATKATLESRADGRCPRLVALVKRVRNAVRGVARSHTPLGARRWAGHVGLCQAPELVLKRLAKQGTRTTVVLVPDDAELFDRSGGTKVLRSLQASTTPPQVVALSDGDHPGYHQSVLNAVRRLVLDVSAPSAAHTRVGARRRYLRRRPARDPAKLSP